MEELQRLVDQIRTGIREGKSDQEIFHFLRPFLGRDPEVDSEVAELLGTIPHETAGRLLYRMLEVSEAKKVRKVIKRSLYRLKSRGISIEEAPRGREASILHPVEGEPKRGFGTGIDFLGRRLLLLVIPHAGRGWAVMWGVVGDKDGLADFSGEEMPRRDFRRFFEELQKKSALPLVEMDPSYVGFLFSQAYQLTVVQKRTPPRDFLRFKSEIEGARKFYEKPLIYSYLQADEIEGNDYLLRRTADLLKEDLFSGWRIEKDQIKPYADAVWEAEESKIVLHQSQKEARFQEIYSKALAELFSDGERLLYLQRLEEMAYILFKSGRLEEARISLAGAIDLKKPINPLNPNPFLYQLVIKSIFILLAESYEKKTKEPSFIVKP